MAGNSGLDKESSDRLLSVVRFIEGAYAGFGFCLSEESDLLSQWRGYADDGHGVAIGFDSRKLEVFGDAFELSKVLYLASEHEAAIRPLIKKYCELKLSGGLNAHAIERELGSLILHLFLMKSAAFSEEREWRLLATTPTDGPTPWKFRASRDRVIPFVEAALENDAIVEVVLGPKHVSPTHVVMACLEENGFSDVEVRCSTATYR